MHFDISSYIAHFGKLGRSVSVCVLPHMNRCCLQDQLRAVCYKMHMNLMSSQIFKCCIYHLNKLMFNLMLFTYFRSLDIMVILVEGYWSS